MNRVVVVDRGEVDRGDRGDATVRVLGASIRVDWVGLRDRVIRYSGARFDGDAATMREDGARTRAIARASCVAIAATVTCALASYLGGAMAFQAPSEREWVIARDGITGVADAARIAMATLDGCARRDESA